MGIIQFFIIVLLIGLAVALINKFAPIDAQYKNLILWAGIVVCVLIFLWALGLLPIGHDVAIPRIR